MTELRDPATRERTSDSSWLRYFQPALLACITSIIGGMSGAYLTLTLTVYRVGVLEGHEQDDKQRFANDDKRDTAQDIAIGQHEVRIGTIERKVLFPGAP